MSLVAYADASPSGLASMLGGLIDQNLTREPGRARLLRPGVFVIDAADADVSVTLFVSPDGVTVNEGSHPGAEVRVLADANRLLAIAGAPLRFGFPDLFSRQGRAVLTDILRGRVQIAGLLRHPLSVARLTRLLSAR